MKTIFPSEVTVEANEDHLFTKRSEGETKEQRDNENKTEG